MRAVVKETRLIKAVSFSAGPLAEEPSHQGPDSGLSPPPPLLSGRARVKSQWFCGELFDCVKWGA